MNKRKSEKKSVDKYDYTDGPEKPQRKSIRLKGYDYSGSGMYFVTVCTQFRECLFGEIRDGKMRMNDAGMMVKNVLCGITEFYPSVEIDAFVVMPNHFHGIITLDNTVENSQIISLPAVVKRLKTYTSKKYGDGVHRHNWRPFAGKLWQRNYWERVIRDEIELNRIREYIQYNPKNWETDEMFVTRE